MLSYRVLADPMESPEYYGPYDMLCKDGECTYPLPEGLTSTYLDLKFQIKTVEPKQSAVLMAISAKGKKTASQ